MIEFQIHPDHYRHWKLEFDAPVAWLGMDVDQAGGLERGYELKLNSYDLGVDIELYDAIQRIRFEHPKIRTVVIHSLKDRVFCSGANIRMLAQSSHANKVNFCKFTNETRNGIEDGSRHSGLQFICAINGTAAGGGYELALACDYIMLVDDGNATVSLPEVPLLAVLPGTGGLTRLVDKRKVRRDHADFFCTVEEGIKGKRAVEWRLVDELVPASRFREVVAERAREFAAKSDRPVDGQGVALAELNRTVDGDRIAYRLVKVEIDRAQNAATVIVSGPAGAPPDDIDRTPDAATALWPFALARQLDDLILYLRANEPEIGTLIMKTEGVGEHVLAWDDFLLGKRDHWLAREILAYLVRVLKRLEVTSRSLIALVEPGSCFAGSLLELALGADRSYMLDGQFEDNDTPAPTVMLGALNFGPLPMVNDLTRLSSRYLDTPDTVDALKKSIGQPLDAQDARDARLVTFAPDDIDWDDEVRLAIGARASFSPDALTGMEANLRFGGPETIESKIFARLSAWQNWIFQRPNAIGELGALRLYGSGKRGQFDKVRV